MKKIYILLLSILISNLSFGQTVFINEIHYDDASSDSGEGIEIAGPAGTDLTGYTLTPYNGNGGAPYTPMVSLTGIIPNQNNGYGTLWFDLSGLQNGAPDGIVLSNGTTVIQFLSYEGSFTGVGGVADGVTSTDIGVSESGTVEGSSLQLTGSGTLYTNFSWATEATATPGLINTGQTFGAAVPSLTLSDGPANGATEIGDPETPSNANIDFTTTNFTMSTDAGGGTGTGGDGFIKWSIVTSPGNVPVDNGNIFTSNNTSVTYPVNGIVAGGSYFFRAELVNNSGNPLTTPVVYSFTLTVATYNDVPNIAALRAGTVDPNVYYRITGQVFNTYSRTSNNQKYFQDATGGILVHDPNFIISTVYNSGDGVTNMRGHLELYNGLIEFVPTDNDNWGKSSTGNTISPQVISLATLNSNLQTYESKLVRINAVTFADGNGVNTFSSNQNYVINDGTASTFRTTFFEADYIGQLIPTGPTNLVALVGSFNGTAQLTARSLSELTLSTSFKQIEKFEMYPNPTNLGFVNLFSKSKSLMKVVVFDVLGKQVKSESVSNNKLNISSLNSGIYVMKVSQDDATITKKLVVN